MAVAKLSQEQMKKISMIELASTVLAEAKTEMSFIDLFNKVAELKGYTQKENLLARFYTDLNVDGRFMAMGGNVWALKRWYPADQTAEKTLAESRKRRMEEDEEDEEYDEYADEAAYEKTYDEEVELPTENEDDVEEDEFDKFDRVDEMDDFDE